MKSLQHAVSLLVLLAMPLIAHAETTTYLDTVPTSDDLIQALEKKEEPQVRMRGIRLGTITEPVVQNQQSVSQSKQSEVGKQASSDKVAAQKTPGVAPQELPRVALNIPFAYSSAELSAEAYKVLGVLGKALSSEQLAGSTILLEGHTDSRGSAEYNKVLSLRRAQSVQNYLTSQFNISKKRVAVRGYGEQRPLNTVNPAGSENRRVEVVNVGK